MASEDGSSISSPKNRNGGPISVSVTMSSPKGEGGESPKGEGGAAWCLCSPTTHQGSFRCRFHRSQSSAWMRRSNSMPKSTTTTTLKSVDMM